MDLLSFFTSLWHSALQPMNLIFICTILFFGLIALFTRLDKNVITMLGILGTFIGILRGLANMDTNNISESIPLLLEGLKTAFITSVVGLFVTIFLSIFERKENKKEEIDFLREMTLFQKNGLEKLSEFFASYKDSTQKNFEKNELLLEAILNVNKSIGGDNDTSLLTQFSKLRTDISDGNKELKMIIKKKQDELINEFRIFATKIGDASMEKMIEAVQRVMDDFDQKINDQLGQSFKELTTAIDNLLLWQSEYKENIITQTENLEKTSEALQGSVQAISDVTEKSQKFADVSAHFDEGLINLNSSLGILKSGLSEFDSIAKNSKDASNQIIESIDSLKDNFVKKAEVIVEESENHIKNMKKVLQDQMENIESTQKELLKKFLEKTETQMDEANKVHRAMNEKMKDSVEGITKTLSETTTGLHDTHKEILEDIQQKSKTEMGNYTEFLKDNLSQQMSHISDTHKEILTDTQKTFEEQNDQAKREFNRIHSDLASLVGEAHQESAKMIKGMKEEISGFSGKLQEIFEVNVREMQDSYEKILRSAKDDITQNTKQVISMRETMKKDFEEFDRIMGEELNKALTTLGQQLTALSAKFVSDYTNLATKLEQIARIANK